MYVYIYTYIYIYIYIIAYAHITKHTHVAYPRLLCHLHPPNRFSSSSFPRSPISLQVLFDPTNESTKSECKTVDMLSQKWQYMCDDSQLGPLLGFNGLVPGEGICVHILVVSVRKRETEGETEYVSRVTVETSIRIQWSSIWCTYTYICVYSWGWGGICAKYHR